MNLSPPTQGNNVADIFPFETLCKFFEQVSGLSGVKRKKQSISSFIHKWSDKYVQLSASSGPISAGLASFYPVLRLLLPSADRARGAFGIGESSMARILIKAFGLAPKGPDALNLLKHQGSSLSQGAFHRDLADIVQRVLKDHCQNDGVYTITQIHEILDDLAKTLTHDGKIAIISRFIRTATILELKWFVRIVSRRDLSLGIGDKVILNCLHPAAVSIWEVTQSLSTVCQRIADIDPKTVLSEDASHKLLRVELFTPFKPMLCARANSAESICLGYQQLFAGSVDAGLCLEVKYDGERVQLHKSGNNYRFWSRSGREWTVSYGGNGDSNHGTLTHRLHGNGLTFASHVTDCILDGEMLAFDSRKNRFVTKATGYDVKRGRFEDEVAKNKNILPCYIVFDILYLNGQTKLARYFDTWVQHGAEGLVAKALCTTYVPNGRNQVGWWKLKPDYVAGLCTDLDCLIVGAYNTTAGNVTAAATRQTRFLSFLCAVIDDEASERESKRARKEIDASDIPTFLTFCQVTNGLKREQLESINRRLESHWRPYDRRKINSGDTEWLCVKGERPDFWVPPRRSLVLQIHAAEMTPSASYSAGYTLRFPRVSAIREDKNWETVASVSEVRRLYHDTKGKMVETKKGYHPDEDSDSSAVGIDEQGTSDFSSAYDTPTKPTQKPAKPAGSILAPYCSLEEESVKVESTVFKDLEFCLYISSRFSAPSADFTTKSDLEKAIVKMSGKVVQNPGTTTDYVIADVVTIKLLTEKALSERKRILLTIFSSINFTIEEVSSQVTNCFNPVDADDSITDVEETEQLEQDRLLSLFTVIKGALYLGGFVISPPDKVSNLVEATQKHTARGREGGYDIFSTDWLIRCILEKRLLLPKEPEVFAARPSTHCDVE
nr:dna ligase 4 [Hymenolepis microstoma]